MARPRTTHLHLPKYVNVIHGAYWYRPPGQKSVRVGQVGDDAGLYKFLAKTLEPAGPLTTLDKIFDKYGTEVLPALKPATQKLYRSCIRALRPVFGPAHPNDVEIKDVGRFINAGSAKILRNRQVAVLSAVYGYAVGVWYVADKNPCIGLKRHKRGKRSRYVSDAELAAFSAICGPRMQIAIELGYLTAQRQKDLLEWKWADVANGYMGVEQSKGGARRDIRISERLEAALARAKKMLPELPREYILRKRNGKPYSGDGFRAIWQRKMRKFVEAGGERFTFHDIRAKAISDAKSLQAAFDLSGHSSIDLTRGTYDRGIRRVEPTK